MPNTWCVYACEVIDGKYTDDSTTEYTYKSARPARDRFARLIGECLSEADGNFTVKRYENAAGDWAFIRTAENTAANVQDGWVVSMFEEKPQIKITV